MVMVPISSGATWDTVLSHTNYRSHSWKLTWNDTDLPGEDYVSRMGSDSTLIVKCVCVCV